MSRWLSPLLVLCVGCAYYNGMWSAQRLAREARRYESNGQEAEARLSWARAAVKADSMLAHHPRSRWADDALVLKAEGMARSGACASAAAVLSEALQEAAPSLHERAALAAATCAFEGGEFAAAERLAAPVLDSRDASRRSQAAWVTGRAAAARGDPRAAAALFARADRPGADAAWVRALVAAGQVDSAVGLLARVPARRLREDDWSPVFGEVATVQGPEVASRSLDRFLEGRRVPLGVRARLLLADGDRLYAAGIEEPALQRYAAVATLVPDSAEGARARLGGLRVGAASALDRGALAQVQERLDAFGGRLQSGPAGRDAQAFQHLLRQVLAPDSSEAAAFRAAEIARDSLRARGLAAELFLGFARRTPQSVFAPKAIVAALALRPAVADSLVAVLDSAYSGSPYTRALRGEASAAFAIIEDSLAQALGVREAGPAIARSGGGALGVGAVAAPRPGPRGPTLDPPVAPGAAQSPLLPRRPVTEPARPVRPSERPRPEVKP